MAPEQAKAVAGREGAGGSAQEACVCGDEG